MEEDTEARVKVVPSNGYHGGKGSPWYTIGGRAVSARGILVYLSKVLKSAS